MFIQPFLKLTLCKINRIDSDYIWRMHLYVLAVSERANSIYDQFFGIRIREQFAAFLLISRYFYF